MHAAICETFWINSIPYTSDQLEGGSICPQYTCILLYVKLILCRSIPYIYGQLEGYICLKYMYIVIYVKCICCRSIPYIYGQLDRGYICPLYMCILLYVKLIWLVIFNTFMVNGGVHLP